MVSDKNIEIMFELLDMYKMSIIDGVSASDHNVNHYLARIQELVCLLTMAAIERGMSFDELETHFRPIPF